MTAGTGGAATTYQGDHFVSAMSAFMLRHIPVEPAFPAGKMYTLQNVPYYHNTKVIFQTRSPFWEKDNSPPPWSSTSQSSVTFGERPRTSRPRVDYLLGTLHRSADGDGAAAAYRRKLYPGERRISRRRKR